MIAGSGIRKLAHGRVAFALHELSPRREGSDLPPLLLLHALGASTEAWRSALPDWSGGLHGLDFAGHGASDRIVGGGYYAEYFLSEADLALAAVGDRAAVAGAGIGAYVALLLAGSRPERVPAALLFPGAGLAGAGSMPGFDAPDVVSLEQREEQIRTDSVGYAPGTDPMVSIAGRDYRPDGYVASFAKSARRLLLADLEPEADAAPSWWNIASAAPGAERVAGDRSAAFARLTQCAR